MKSIYPKTVFIVIEFAKRHCFNWKLTFYWIISPSYSSLWSETRIRYCNPISVPGGGNVGIDRAGAAVYIEATVQRIGRSRSPLFISGCIPWQWQLGRESWRSARGSEEADVPRTGHIPQPPAPLLNIVVVHRKKNSPPTRASPDRSHGRLHSLSDRSSQSIK
jgi:hypothetical protein